MFFVFSSGSVGGFAMLLVCFAFLLSNARASIRVVDLGKEYQSRTDKYVGLQMKEGMEYDARLQTIPGDEHFCGSTKYNVTVPEDGVPVALLVKKGLCSSAQKAEFASRNIYPRGVVKILIIDGEIRIHDNGKGKYKHKHKYKRHHTYDTEDDHDVDDDDDDDDDDDAEYLNEVQNPSLPYYNNGDDRKVTMAKKRGDDISVALLHISYRTGDELVDLLLNEDPSVKSAGGTRVTVDDVSPPMTGAVVVVWTLVALVLSILLCCCMANALEDILDAQEAETEVVVRRRPRRQRLTVDQVRKYPEGFFDGTRLVYDDDEEEDDDAFHDETDGGCLCSQKSKSKSKSKSNLIRPTTNSMDACTICLDDYEVGDRLRCLPCGHAFHADCIAKWLIERSATCPLCNLNLYEEEVDEDEDENENNEEDGTVEPSLVSSGDSSLGSWWRAIVRAFRQQNRTELESMEALTESLLPHREETSVEATPGGIAIETTPSDDEDSNPVRTADDV